MHLFWLFTLLHLDWQFRVLCNGIIMICVDELMFLTLFLVVICFLIILVILFKYRIFWHYVQAVIMMGPYFTVI